MEEQTVWVGMAVAASVLGVGAVRLTQLAQEGRITREKGRGPKGRYGYCLRSLNALAAEREAHKPPPFDQQHRRKMHGRHHAHTTAPLADRLLSTREAAERLGISPASISGLVYRGRLCAYQQKLGQPGSRLYVSEQQVTRLLNDPVYQRFRARYTQTCGRKGGTTATPRWTSEAAFDWYAPTPATRKEHGCYYTARQAAHILGISLRAIQFLRKRGRLTGYRNLRHPDRKPSARAWWFFRKDDVFLLRFSPEYRRRHHSAVAQVEAAREKRLLTDTETCARGMRRNRQRLESFGAD
jgi:transposase